MWHSQYCLTLEFIQSISRFILFSLPPIHSTKPLIHTVYFRPLGYERVYLPLCKVADAPFHIQGDEMMGQPLLSR